MHTAVDIINAVNRENIRLQLVRKHLSFLPTHRRSNEQTLVHAVFYCRTSFTCSSYMETWKIELKSICPSQVRFAADKSMTTEFNFSKRMAVQPFPHNCCSFHIWFSLFGLQVIFRLLNHHIVLNPAALVKFNTNSSSICCNNWVTEDGLDLNTTRQVCLETDPNHWLDA